MLEAIYKKCTCCKIEKEIIFFNKDKHKKDGLTARCKKCRSIDKNKYYNLNKEEYNRKERERHHIKKIERNNKKIEYYRNNKKTISERIKKYRNTPIGMAVFKNSIHKRRSKIKKGDVLTKQLLELQQNAKVCYWCNTSLKDNTIHIDHYIPLSKGGEHTLSNLVVSCQRCNNKKSSKDPIIFANSIGKLL